MKKFDEWWMPDDEEHLPGWMNSVQRRVDGRLTYQYGKYDEAMKHVKNRARAVDVGAHIGLWSYFMARDFDNVIAFEPMEEHAACWLKNMETKNNAELWNFALGEEEGQCILETRTIGSSGDTQVVAGADGGDIKMQTLDFFELDDVGLIKIDCEGFEEFVLRGARETLMRCKPVVIVEQKGDMSARYGLGKQSAVEFLKAMGASLKMEISGDFILAWD